MKRSFMFARFPYGRSEDPDTVNWLIRTYHKAKTDPRVSDVFMFTGIDTPISMLRNRAVKEAQAKRADFLVMVDSDMNPDLPYPDAKPFWDSSIDFLERYEKPCIVTAPYCGAPPFENVFVFQWANKQTDNPNPDYHLEQYTREQAALMAGMEAVAAGPTGLIIIDMRVFRKLKAPWFYYEWSDAAETEKASTEDVTFTRDASLAGFPVFCNWDSWAGHWKYKCVGKPQRIGSERISAAFRHSMLQNMPSNARVVMVGDDDPNNDPPGRPPYTGFGSLNLDEHLRPAAQELGGIASQMINEQSPELRATTQPTKAEVELMEWHARQRGQTLPRGV